VYCECGERLCVYGYLLVSVVFGGRVVRVNGKNKVATEAKQSIEWIGVEEQRVMWTYPTATVTIVSVCERRVISYLYGNMFGGSCIKSVSPLSLILDYDNNCPFVYDGNNKTFDGR
jgi:hypothetical protein